MSKYYGKLVDLIDEWRYGEHVQLPPEVVVHLLNKLEPLCVKAEKRGRRKERKWWQAHEPWFRANDPPPQFDPDKLRTLIEMAYKRGETDPGLGKGYYLLAWNDISDAYQELIDTSPAVKSFDTDEVWLKMSTLYQLAWFAHSSEDNRDAYWDSFKHLHTALLAALGLDDA